MNHTLPVRNFLNEKGIYQQLNRYGLPTQSKTGFSENDKQLGGPINDDLSILFTGEQPFEHYWRVETKKYYTGKGWQANSEVSRTKTPIMLVDTNYHASFKEETISKLSFKTNDTYLPTPYGKIQVPSTQNEQIELIDAKNRLDFDQRPDKLSLSFQEPKYTSNDLKLVELNVSDELQSETQLPDTLPNQVRELALSLTDSQVTLYDKVKTVEQHLKTNDSYRYSKTDTTYPPNEKDYVDYFLFESKTGYCDNFSTAMIVLLRSAGIPSRWAKGFAPGDIIETSTKTKTYAIRNSHAHSWPEVYFEGYGWIPFEPTPGFERINESVNSDSSTMNSSEARQKPETNSTSSSTSKTVRSADSSTTSTQENKQKKKPLNVLRLFQLIGLFFSFLLVSILIFFGSKNFFNFYFKIYQLLPTTDFYSSYTIVLKKAERILARHSNEPLTEYVQRFEAEYIQFHGAFLQLTIMYEQALYGKQLMNSTEYTALLNQVAIVLSSLRNKKNKQ